MQLCPFLIDLFHLANIFNVVGCVKIAFPFKAEKCIDHILLIWSSVGTHFGYFEHLAIVSNTIMSMNIHISVWVPAFTYFGDIPSSRIAGSYTDTLLIHHLCKLFCWLKEHSVSLLCTIKKFTISLKTTQSTWLDGGGSVFTYLFT